MQLSKMNVQLAPLLITALASAASVAGIELKDIVIGPDKCVPKESSTSNKELREELAIVGAKCILANGVNDDDHKEGPRLDKAGHDQRAISYYLCGQDATEEKGTSRFKSNPRSSSSSLTNCVADNAPSLCKKGYAAMGYKLLSVRTQLGNKGRFCTTPGSFKTWQELLKDLGCDKADLDSLGKLLSDHVYEAGFDDTTKKLCTKK